MEYLSDLTKEYVTKTSGKVVKEEEYKTLNGEIFTKYTTASGKTYCFLDNIVATCKHKNRSTLFNKALEDQTEDYQDFLLQRTYGIQRSSILNKAIECQLAKIEEKLEALNEIVFDGMEIDEEDFLLDENKLNEKYQPNVTETFKRYLSLIERDFAFRLDGCSSEEDFRAIVEVSQSLGAVNDRVMQKHIQSFLEKYVSRTINEKGEEVFEFSKSQNCMYEFLRGLREDLAFTFRYQVYRADQKEDQVLQKED